MHIVSYVKDCTNYLKKFTNKHDLECFIENFRLDASEASWIEYYVLDVGSLVIVDKHIVVIAG